MADQRGVESVPDIASPSLSRPATRDLAALLDAHRWSAYQILIVLLASSAILLDGFDNQALGFALPMILAEWRLPKSAFAPALAASQFGMMVGAILGGVCGDRFGRKMALLFSVALFGAATLCIAWVSSVAQLAVLRFIAGIGLGAAFPNVAALVAEFTPARRRSLAVTIGIVSVPSGGSIGGLVAASILPTHGWRALFVLSGIAPLLALVGLWLLLPESIAFLARRGAAGAARIARTCARIGIAVPAPSALPGTDGATGGIAGLLRDGFARDTLLLWLAFFFCLASIYTAFNWLPTLLVSSGFDVAMASAGLAAFNMGGVVAAVFTGWLIGRTGSRRPMVVLAMASVLSACLIVAFPIEGGVARAPLLCALAIEGGCVNGVQTTLYALAAHIYPTRNRATGVGAAAGFGRVGAMLSSLAGGAAGAASAAAAFHGLIAVAMALVTVALLLIARHYQPRGAQAVDVVPEQAVT